MAQPVGILSAPACSAQAVVPDDGMETEYRGLYVGGTGNVRVRMVSNEEVTFTAVPTGLVLPVRVKAVLATGTTATAIVGLL